MGPGGDKRARAHCQMQQGACSETRGLPHRPRGGAPAAGAHLLTSVPKASCSTLELEKARKELRSTFWPPPNSTESQGTNTPHHESRRQEPKGLCRLNHAPLESLPTLCSAGCPAPPSSAPRFRTRLPGALPETGSGRRLVSRGLVLFGSSARPDHNQGGARRTTEASLGQARPRGTLGRLLARAQHAGAQRGRGVGGALEATPTIFSRVRASWYAESMLLHSSSPVLRPAERGQKRLPSRLLFSCLAPALCLFPILEYFASQVEK